MIEEGTIFNGWFTATEEEARKYIKSIVKGMLCSEEERIKYINKNRLRGITYEELFKNE